MVVTSVSEQLSVQGTMSAFTKNGTKIIDNKQNNITDKNIFFIF